MKNVVQQHMNINYAMSQIELNKAIIQRYFAEYIALPQRNVFKTPGGMDWDLAASLPVNGLTPFHALNEVGLKLNEFLLVLWASGNTGMIATQLGKKIGAKVIAISEEE
jgi:NADPH:quinone reductase-like Zn-dependent oxidoreductase